MATSTWGDSWGTSWASAWNSIVAVGVTPNRNQVLTGVLPVIISPNATQPKSWRAAAGWGYPPIAVGDAVAADGNIYIPILRRRRR